MLDVSADFRALERALDDIPRKQLPFAMMMALNDTAQDVKRAEERQMERKLDRPTPYTKRGIYLRRATKRGLTAWVGVKDRQAAYLRYQVSGGVRSGFRLPIGVGLRRNKYGNVPRGASKRARARGDTFVADGKGRTAHLKPGLYRRPKAGRYRNGGRGSKNVGKQKGPQLLLAFKARMTYKPRFPFEQTALRTSRATLPGHLARRLQDAVKTAR